MRTTILAVTTGDPAGIGPEIVAKLFAAYRPRRSRALVVGARRVCAGFLKETGAPVLTPDLVRDGALAESAGGVFFVDTGCKERYPRGKDSRGGGAHAGAALELACELGRAGAVGGIVTAPISKRALDLAGYHYAGHTEMLARYFNRPDCQMVMCYKDFRVVPLTRHVPLSRVRRLVTTERILTALRVVNRALIDQFDVREPRIAVAALNPHAGDGGLFGSEDAEVVAPAIRRARRGGLRVTGPVPADALFTQAASGTFDAFVSMYHDQGLIPFKMMAQKRGVNVTVGLPIVRTSVDHGVAYDIAGRGTADAASIGAAYRLAEKMATTKEVSK